VLTTDFETGAFSLVDVDRRSASVNLGLTHSDAVARVDGTRVYVVNRLGQDNVTALDAADGFRTLWQRSTEPGSNPQDIVVVSAEKAYVTRLERTGVLVLDPRDGSIRGEVDCAALADADGVPEMSAGAAAGDRVVFAAERLDRDDEYRPAGRGALAVVDPARDAIERTVELTGSNPYGDLAALADGRLLIAEAGVFGQVDGGIEAVDAATWTAGGYLVTEETLGGDVTSFVVADDGTIWAIVSSPDFATSLVRYDPADGSLRTAAADPGFAFSCVARVSGDLLGVCDRTRTRPGVRLFELPDGSERTAAPIDVGLPPWQIRSLRAW
jgi:outer membrane protein assembly factor BamB